MTIYRGYTWVDLEHNGKNVRIISTHLESLWDSNKVPNAALQAQQLISDTAQTKMPLIVIGDFNSDPRDPRPDANSNPGGQPEASEECLAQVANPTINSAIDTCNAYWLMRRAGFIDVGPDATNSKNFTWGMNALLTGPDEMRLKAAQALGNQAGFTDRLDYIFLKNGAVAVAASLVGTTPYKEGAWLTDHAGVIAAIDLPSNQDVSPALDAHAPFPISFWNWVGIAILTLVAILMKRRRGRKLGS